MTDLTHAFEADLRRSFAAIEDPVDDGFSFAVSAKVGQRERAAKAGMWARAAAFALAGGAAAFGVISLVQGVGPALLTQVGFGVLAVQSALAGGDFSQIGASAILGQTLIALGMGAGGVAAYRAVSE